MRKILFALLCLVSANGFSQVAFEMGAIKIDSVYFKGTSKWADSLVTNAKLPSASDQQIPSAKAVKIFVVDTVAQMIHDSVSAITFTSTSLSDSIDKHTDTLQLHNTRLKVMELIDHTHPNKATIDATTASYTTAINSTITNHTQYIADLNDSIARHTDTLQLHNTRLGELEAAIGGEILIDATLDAAADTFVTINNGSWGYTTSIVGTGTGDVNVSGTTAANTIAYWNGTDSTLVSNDVVKLYADSAVFTEYIMAHDSIYYLPFAGVEAGSIWWTNSVTGAIDSAHTEPAYIGWEMKDLPTLEEYEKDVKMINGHMERRVWYIDYETKELKSQYGWDGLGMMNTQSAYMIYHEITVRWMFEQNKKLEQNKRSVLKRKVKTLEDRIDAIERSLKVYEYSKTLEHRL